MILSALRNLRNHGIVGINKRNIDFLMKHNERKLYPLVDDKLKTKRLAIEAGISVPELYFAIKSPGKIRGLHEKLARYEDFVIKPAHGTGGEGILVINSHYNGRYRLSNGELMDQDEMEFHLSGILSGIYSLAGQPDQVLIEYRVISDPVFKEVSYKGVPDIRVIVFQGVPAMAMLRLPTRKSKGRANLHQGAIGVGIDLKTGITLKAVSENEIISNHPDTGQPIERLQIPGWEAVLELATRSWELTGLKYQGVDIVLDKDKGPMILELNARPGLSIQLANQNGLLPRLEKIEDTADSMKTVEERIAFARENFAA